MFFCPSIRERGHTHIKANANKKKQIKEQVPVASKHYAKELMAEVNADREAHGKKPFDDDTVMPLNFVDPGYFLVAETILYDGLNDKVQ